MGADSTLVNAAFKLGQTEAGANVPNMAPLMQAQVGISAGFTKMARDAMGNHQKKKEIQRVGKSKQLGKFEQVFTNTLTKLYEQEEPLPDEFIDAVTNRVEALQEEFESYNTYGKGDTSENNRARARIMGELKRVTNEVMNFRGGLEKFGMARKDGLLNEGECAESDIAPSQQAMDLDNFSKNAGLGKVEVGYGEDGKLQITSRGYYSDASGSWGDDVVVTINSLEKAFPTINKEQDAGYLASFTESEASGRTDGLKPNAVNNYDGEQRHAEFKATLNTDAAFQNIVSRKIEGAGGNNVSFKDALLSDINIPLNILDTMFYDDNSERVEVGLLFKDLDLDGVDGITQKDHDLAEKMGGEAFEMFETNLDAMIDVITNVNNPAFDRERSAGMLADYLTSMDQEKYNAGFDAAVKSKEKTTGRDGLTQSYGFRTYGQLQGIWDLIDAGGAIIKGPDGTRWLDQGNGTWKHDGSEVILDKNGLKDQFELNHLPKFKVANLDDVELDDDKDAVVPYPKRSITSSNFDMSSNSADQVLYDLEETYKDYPGFKFKNSSSTLLIIAPDGTKKYIEMNRSFGGNKKSQDEIQAFIIKHAKTEEK